MPRRRGCNRARDLTQEIRFESVVLPEGWPWRKPGRIAPPGAVLQTPPGRAALCHVEDVALDGA